MEAVRLIYNLRQVTHKSCVDYLEAFYMAMDNVKSRDGFMGSDTGSMKFDIKAAGNDPYKALTYDLTTAGDTARGKFSEWCY